MVRSQSVVFGYGAIIPTETFVNLVPGSFVYDNKYKNWVPERVLDLDFERNGIQIFYSEIEKTNNIFLTSMTSTDFNFEKGTIFNQVESVDMTTILQEQANMDNFIRTYFPGINPGFYMYAYYTP